MNDEQMFALWNYVLNKSNITEEEIISIANRKSTGIFNKIRFNIVFELLLNVISCFVILYFIHNHEEDSFIISLILFSSYMILIVWFYLKYYFRLDRINEKNIINSIKQKIDILNRYINTLKLYNLFIGPLIYFFCLYLVFKNSELTHWTILEICFFSVLGLMVAKLIEKEMIFNLYGKHLERLQDIYFGMKTIDSNN